MSSCRSGLRLTLDLQIHAVTCPGERLLHKFPIYVKVCILNQQKKTCPQRPAFPIYFTDTLLFNKSFPTCRTLTELCTELDGEDHHAHFELVQVVDEFGCEVVLAEHESTLRQFLFPCDRLITYTGHPAGSNRTLLMTRTVHHLGISPRLEFSTKSVISESLTPMLDYISDVSRPDDPYYDMELGKSPSSRPSSGCPIHSNRVSKCPRHPYICSGRGAVSGVTKGGAARSWHTPNHAKSSGAGSEVMLCCEACGGCGCEVVRRVGRHLASHPSHPAHTSHTSRQHGHRPPFVVRKVPDKVLECAACPHVTDKVVKTTASPPDDIVIDDSVKSYDRTGIDNLLRWSINVEDEVSGGGGYPHRPEVCTVCRLYQQYMGKPYHPHSTAHRTQPTAHRTQPQPTAHRTQPTARRTQPTAHRTQPTAHAHHHHLPASPSHHHTRLPLPQQRDAGLDERLARLYADLHRSYERTGVTLSHP